MVFSYDSTTDAGIVRLLIGDTNDDGHLFEDAEITAFLTLNGNRTRLAAAQALEAIAANQVMVLKVMTLHDLQLDGAAVARELRLQATSLRGQDADGIGETDADDLFDIAEFGIDRFSRREILHNDALRGAL